MKRILMAAFEGENNSAFVMASKMKHKNILFLKNHKEASCMQLKQAVEAFRPDEIILFGQKPAIKNKCTLERYAKNGDSVLETKYDYEELRKYLLANSIKATISSNCGTSYCNHIYYYAMKNYPDIKTIFIHIPYLKNLQEPDRWAKQIEASLI